MSALEEALGRFSAETGVPVFLATDVAAPLRRAPQQLTLSFEGSLPGKVILDLLLRSHARGLAADVRADRVVVVPEGTQSDAAVEEVAVPAPAAPLPVFTVRGSVRDPDGTVVPGASVVRTFDGRTVATSGANGEFEFRTRRPLPAVTARLQGRVPSATAAVVVEGGVAREVALVLGPPSGTVAVLVTAEGAPVPGATVRVGPVVEEEVEGPGGGRVARKRVRGGATSDDGRFGCDDAPPGTVRVVVLSSAHREATRDVEVVAGERTDVEVVLIARPSLRDHVETVRVSFEFRDTPLRDVAAFLARATETTVVVLPYRASAGVRTALTLSARDLPLAQALRDVCAAAGPLTFDLDEERRIVSIRERGE